MNNVENMELYTYNRKADFLNGLEHAVTLRQHCCHELRQYMRGWKLRVISAIWKDSNRTRPTPLRLLHRTVCRYQDQPSRSLPYLHHLRLVQSRSKLCHKRTSISNACRLLFCTAWRLTMIISVRPDQSNGSFRVSLRRCCT